MIWVIISYIIFVVSAVIISRVYLEVPRQTAGILVIILTMIGWAVASPVVPALHVTQLAFSGHASANDSKTATATYNFGIYHIHLEETKPLFIEGGGAPLTDLEAVGRGPLSFNKSQILVTGMCGTTNMPCPGRAAQVFNPHSPSSGLASTSDPLSVKRTAAHTLMINSKEGVWSVTVGSGISLWRMIIFLGIILGAFGLGEQQRRHNKITRITRETTNQ